MSNISNAHRDATVCTRSLPERFNVIDIERLMAIDKSGITFFFHFSTGIVYNLTRNRRFSKSRFLPQPLKMLTDSVPDVVRGRARFYYSISWNLNPSWVPSRIYFFKFANLFIFWESWSVFGVGQCLGDFNDFSGPPFTLISERFPDLGVQVNHAGGPTEIAKFQQKLYRFKTYFV